jgi:hypothetical protein
MYFINIFYYSVSTSQHILSLHVDSVATHGHPPSINKIVQLDIAFEE